jgi:uncharacterized membrane protein
LLSVILFSRKNCHLCKIAEEDLNGLQAKFPHKLTIMDVEGDPDLEKKYGLEIPVVKVGPYTLKAPFDKQTIEMTLGAASDRKRQLDDLGNKEYLVRAERANSISSGDRFSIWFSKHYMLIFNLFVLIYVGIPFLAPVLLRSGAEKPAAIIYRVYGALCHQLSYRSWFLFGEQPYYPREEAGMDDILTFHEATGLDETGIYEARSFLGTEEMGYKVALCQRDVAIYGAILLFGVIFVITGRRIKSLPFWLWILMGIIPIGFDGGTQIMSQFIQASSLDFLEPILGMLPLRESTPFLRTMTGFLFGFTTAWFGYPLVEEAMHDARTILATKITRLEGKT